MADPMTPDWLERANRLAITGLLLSTTVHEVNNALQVITGSAETLTPASPPDVVGRRAETIGAQARRASALLAELSSFARDDSVGTTPLDLAHVAQRALAIRQYAIAKLKLESSLETSGGPRMIAANHRTALQIVLNLLLNAERALEGRPGGRIVVSVDGGSDRVTLAVEDNGPGVDAAAVSKLFVPAALASESNLGIGLSVARNLAACYGGTINYTPRSEGGSRFAAAFPRSG